MHFLNMRGTLFSLVFISVAFKPSLESVSVKSLRIYSDIKYRFARTILSTLVENRESTATEIEFKVAIPEEALISNLTIETDGKIYSGIVTEKSSANDQYEQARKGSQTAGFISAKPRKANNYKVRINVEAEKTVLFNITYEELLRRHIGKYEHVIYVNPGQAVEDFNIDVNIHESRNITKLKVPPIRQDLIEVTTSSADTGNINDVIIENVLPNSASVIYAPTTEQQLAVSPDGISGQFVVQYDMDRDTDFSDILISNGKFIHFFAANGLPPLPKKILFVLDVSGSMRGTKMQQLVQAMISILDDLKNADQFNMLLFNSLTRVWKTQQMIEATQAHKEEAKTFLLEYSHVQGSTNINLAMSDSLELMHSTSNGKNAPVIVFLSDGHSNAGIQDKEQILNSIRQQNKLSVPIFCLGFGTSADNNFLAKISTQNFGFARVIYADTDADLQIVGFYEEISTVVLTNVTFSYLDTEVSTKGLTKTHVNTLFEGSEYVIAGMTIDPEVQTIHPVITGNGISGAIVLNNSLVIDTEFESMAEKLWAFLVIKQLIRKNDASYLPRLSSKVTLTALSLKYNFVTPFTALVLTVPGSDNRTTLDNADDDTEAKTETVDQASNLVPSKQNGNVVRIASKSGGAFSKINPHMGPVKNVNTDTNTTDTTTDFQVSSHSGRMQYSLYLTVIFMLEAVHFWW